MIKTFEQIFKNELKNMITNLCNKDIVISNDVNFKPLEEDINSIVGIIKSGNGTKSYVRGYDFTTYPINISFILDVNYLQEFLGRLNLVAESSGLFKTVNYNNKDYTYQAVFNTPMSMGNPVDIRCKEKKVKVQIVSMMGNIVYTSNGCIVPKEFTLQIGTTEYPVNGLFTYSMSSIPAVEPLARINNIYLDYRVSSVTKSYTLYLLKMSNDPLHSLLSDYLDSDTYLDKVKVKIGSKPYFDALIQFEEKYENQASVLVVTLTR